MSQIQVTLKKSVIGQPKKHRAVISSLGLRKINQMVQLKDTVEIRGMIGKVPHLLAVLDIKDKKVTKPEIVTKKVEGEKTAAIKEKEASVEEKIAAKDAAEITAEAEKKDTEKIAIPKETAKKTAAEKKPEKEARKKAEVAAPKETEKKVSAEKKAEKETAAEKKVSAEKKTVAAKETNKTPKKEVAA